MIHVTRGTGMWRVYSRIEIRGTFMAPPSRFRLLAGLMPIRPAKPELSVGQRSNFLDRLPTDFVPILHVFLKTKSLPDLHDLTRGVRGTLSLLARSALS